MKFRFSQLMGLYLAAFLGLVLAFNAVAQNKPAKPPKMTNIQGRVQMMSKDKMTITVASGTTRRDVVYSGDTAFKYGHSKDNKPGSVDQVKEGYYISCAGTFEKGKVQLTAKECVYREQK